MCVNCDYEYYDDYGEEQLDEFYILTYHDANGALIKYDWYHLEDEGMAWYDLEEERSVGGTSLEVRLYSIDVQPGLSQAQLDELFQQIVKEGIEESGGERLDIGL